MCHQVSRTYRLESHSGSSVLVVIKKTTKKNKQKTPKAINQWFSDILLPSTPEVCDASPSVAGGHYGYTKGRVRRDEFLKKPR